MSPEADRLLEIALKKVGLRDGFSPAQLGARVGLSKWQSELAARALADAGVLVLGFDHSAEFSDDYRRARTPAVAAATTTPKKKGRPTKAASVARHVASRAVPSRQDS
jgi:hypothetical protein